MAWAEIDLNYLINFKQAIFIIAKEAGIVLTQGNAEYLLQKFPYPEKLYHRTQSIPSMF